MKARNVLRGAVLVAVFGVCVSLTLAEGAATNAPAKPPSKEEVRALKLEYKEAGREAKVQRNKIAEIERGLTKDPDVVAAAAAIDAARKQYEKVLADKVQANPAAAEARAKAEQLEARLAEIKALLK
jgi:hypothetical protein